MFINGNNYKYEYVFSWGEKHCPAPNAMGRLQDGATILSTWRGFRPTSWADFREKQFWGGGISKLIDSKKRWKDLYTEDQYGNDQNPYNSSVWKDAIPQDEASVDEKPQIVHFVILVISS